MSAVPRGALPYRRAVVLHDALAAGARPDALDNLDQARQIAAALERIGLDAAPVPFSRDVGGVVRRLRAHAPDVVFNLVESLEGEDTQSYAATALLETLGLPFTGSGTAALILTGDKRVAKHLMRAAGLPTPAVLEPGAAPDTRYIVKRACTDASIGIDAGSVVRGLRAAQRRLAERAAVSGDAWLAEVYVEGREFNVSVLAGENGPQVLPIAEIDFGDFPPGRPRIVDYEAKWLPGSFGFEHTPRRFPAGAADAALLREVESLALRCFEVFSLAGYARVDFRVDGSGRPYILEVNANPCLSADAGFMAAAAQAGLDAQAVVARIVAAPAPADAGTVRRPRVARRPGPPLADAARPAA